MNETEIAKQYETGTRDFRGIDLNEANLRNINLSDANLQNVNLNLANLSGANLRGVDLQNAKLNVARLSGANLAQAKLNNTILNVANLIRANLGESDLSNACLIRAEMIRTQLSGAKLTDANLRGADLREATLRQADLSRCDLTEANLRGAFLTTAILEQASLSGANLSRTDLNAVNLREAELRQANLSRADLTGADLRGANLRWADLSGANLRWADLSNAKLSGANLIGADLSHANLLNTSFVHADLTQARLIEADWVGADLTGATLTGAKLYAVSRFGLKTEGLTCDWIDLSPDGDRSKVYQFNSETTQKFFNKTSPSVQITIDAPFDLEANLALAWAYHQISQVYPTLNKPPNINVYARRTVITFQVESNEFLFPIAYCAILPFGDAPIVQHHLLALVKRLQNTEIEELNVKEYQQIQVLTNALNRIVETLKSVNLNQSQLPVTSVDFFQSPTHTILLNSSDQQLDIYHHPALGKHLFDSSGFMAKNPSQNLEQPLPQVTTIIQFIRDFFDQLEPVENS